MLKAQPVYCIIVTYNNRWQYVAKVIASLENNRDVRIVLVNNGSQGGQDIDVLCASFVGYHRIESSVNRGSAWGYAVGIEYVVSQHEHALLFLLDDDNVVERNALAVLKQTYSELSQKIDASKLMLLAYRRSRKYLTAILQGEPVAKYQYTQNEFLGFSLRRAISRVFNYYKSSGERNAADLNYAPFGGLFFSTACAELIGLPDKRYFVYADDFEYTSRCIKLGGRIVLLRNAEVFDLEESWQKQNTRSKFNVNLLVGSPFRVYFATRNFLIFQRSTFVKSSLSFYLNGFTYSIFLLFVALYYCKLKSFGVYLQAVKDAALNNFNNHEWQSRMH